jgi:hypothetical protein
MEKLFKIIDEKGGVGCTLWYDDGRKVNFVSIRSYDDQKWVVDIIEESMNRDREVVKTLVMKTDVDGAIEFIKNNF